MLKVSSLNFSYQENASLLFDGVSFALSVGDILHIGGVNGCGKSTLLSVLAGLTPKQGGEITFFHNKKNTVLDRRYFLEYLEADSNGLFLNLDASENLRFWSSIRRKIAPAKLEQSIAQALQTWGLEYSLAKKGYPVRFFSTGMKRRLSLARVFLSSAPCLILDEPINGLDSKGQIVFQEELNKHKKKGGMAIVVSHHFDQHVPSPFTSRALLTKTGLEMQVFP